MLGNPALGITATTGETWRTALRFLGEAFGPLAPRQLSRRHAAELRDLLTERPARPEKHERRLALRDLVEAYKARPDAPRLSGVTVRQHLRSLSTIWTRAQEEGFIAETLTNPFKGVRVNVEASPDNPQELSQDELKAMFGTPVFTQGERPAGGRGEAAFFMPLLAFFTGARPEEVAQLMVSDTFLDDQGRLCLKITGEGEAHPAKGKRTLKTRKTRTGVRQFPLPEGLMRLGFGEYVEWLKDRGEAALFPLLTTKGSRGLHAGISRWWSRYLHLHRAKPQGKGRRPIRELRQGWASAAIRSRLSQEERKYLMGHALDPQTATGDYGNLNPIGDAMLRVLIDESVVEHVTPWRPPFPLNDTK